MCSLDVIIKRHEKCCLLFKANKLIYFAITNAKLHGYCSLFYLYIKCLFFGLFCCQILGNDQQFWVAINNLMINKPFINGADWCKKQSNVNGLLHTSLFFLQLLNCSQNVNHSPSYITPLSSFKSNLPGSEAIQRAVDLSGEEDKSPVLYLRDEQGRSDEVQEITSKAAQ